MIRRIRRFDWTMLSGILVLLVLSFLFIYSAGYRNVEEAHTALAVRQVIWALIGFGFYAAAAAFDYRKLKDIHWWLYAGALLTLIIVFFFPEKNGSHRWIPMPGFDLQPSEFAKLSVVITLAAWLGNPATDVDELSTFAKTFLLVAVPFFLMVIEPDLGTAMVLLPLLLVVLFCADIPLRPLLILIGAGVSALLVMISGFVFSRIRSPF